MGTIRSSGWGALFLFVYIIAVLYDLGFGTNRIILTTASAGSVLALVFLTASFNDRLMKLFAGDTIREAFSEIKDQTGSEEEFYWHQDIDTRDTIDDLDQRAHQKIVMMFSGSIIAVSLPFFLFYEYGATESLGSTVISIFILYLLCYRPYFELQEIIRSSAKIYSANDES